MLTGREVFGSLGGAFAILRARPCGHIAAELATTCHLSLDRRPSRNRALATQTILCRILDPRSRLGTDRSLRSETLSYTLGEELGLSDPATTELYRAVDWLLTREHRIEHHLAIRHLEDGVLVLSDITSVYFTDWPGSATPATTSAASLG